MTCMAALGELRRRVERPSIQGLDEFRGTLVHMAHWDNRLDLSGKRVAVIGSGASAIQVVPAIQPSEF